MDGSAGSALAGRPANFRDLGRDRMPAMMRAMRRIAMVACLAVLGGAAYWYFGPGQPSQQSQQQKGNRPGFRRGGGNPNDTVPVLAIAARLADVPVYLDGVGTAKALNTVTVRSQVDGKLMKIAFKEGQEVTQGFRHRQDRSDHLSGPIRHRGRQEGAG